MSPERSGVFFAPSSRSSSASMIAAMRSIETPALLISEIIRPSIRTGHVISAQYDRKAMYSPTSISPRTQNAAPKQTVSRICVPDRTSPTLQNVAIGFASFIHRPV